MDLNSKEKTRHNTSIYVFDFYPQVLRFFCIWDDRSTLYGERRPYVLHYFLADDTVEILEVRRVDSGMVSAHSINEMKKR